MKSTGRIFINPARTIRSGEYSFMISKRAFDSSDEIKAESSSKLRCLAGIAKESAMLKIWASGWSEKIAFILVNKAYKRSL